MGRADLSGPRGIRQLLEDLTYGTERLVAVGSRGTIVSSRHAGARVR